MKRVLNKWQPFISINQEPMYDRWGWRMFAVGLVRFHRFPEQGVAFGPSDYDGFILNIRFWFPIEMIKLTIGKRDKK